MDCLIGILLTIVAILVLAKHIIRRRFFEHPGPVGLPGLGQLHMFALTALVSRKPESSFTFFRQNAKRYGDVWSFEMGFQRYIVLGSYEAIREALVDRGDIFAGRPNSAFYEFYTDGFNGIISTEGEKWREHRRITLHILRNFGMGKSVLQEKMHEEISFLEELFLDTMNQPIDASTYFVKAVSNVISVLAFGQRWAYDDDKFIDYINCVTSVTQTGGTSVFLAAFYPFLAKKWIMRYLPVIDQVLANNEKIQSIIQERYRDHKRVYNPADEPTNVMETYMQYAYNLDQQQKRDHSFTERQCVYNLYDLFLAGTDTTTNSLGWAMIMLSVNPEVQVRVQAEIDLVIGRERRPQMSDKTQMPYIQAVMDEVMRYCTVVPRAVEHRVTEEVILRGYRIDPSDVIMPDIYTVHHDPKYWAYPDSFYPEHFLSDNGDQYRPDEHLISFGVGKRSCLGESLARMEYFMFLVGVLQRFSVDLDAESRARLDEIFEGTTGIIHAPGTHKIVLSPR